MNRFKGHIAAIRTHGNLSLVSVKVGQGAELAAIVIDTPPTAAYLREGSEVSVLFKETEVALSTAEEPAISITNRIAGKVIEIAHGVLLSRVRIGSDIGMVVSVIGTDAVEHLALKAGTKVTALVKVNDIILAP